MDVSSGSWWRADDGGVVVSLRVTPGARRSEVLDATGDRLRIRLAAPAVDGKANVELARVLAELFGVRRRAVEIVHGARARDKVVRIGGISMPPPTMTTRPVPQR